jgi:DNA polymerase phi
MGHKKGRSNRKRFNDEEDDDSIPATKRQYTDTDKKLARLYEELADNSSNVRIQAAKELLQELSQNGQLKQEASDKALKRLLRGLCSSRESARSGFFITLTELIRQIYAAENPFIQLPELVALAKDYTHSSGQNSGQVSCCRRTSHSC